MKSDKETKNNFSRRDFVKTTAVGVGAAAVVGLGVKPTEAQDKVLVENWDKEADVVVLGTGFGGIATAVTAHDLGAKVLILEKLPKELEGGNSKVSGNMWWTPTNVADGIKYITALSYGTTDSEMIEVMANELFKNNDWLTGLGLTPAPLGIFQPEYPELPGCESVRTWRNSGTGSAVTYTPLRKLLDTRGIEILYETPGTQLIQNRQKEVIGIQAKSGQKTLNIKATHGVVLACGGYEYGFDLQTQYFPAWPMYGRGCIGNTGDGIKMAQQVGAALWHMNTADAGLGCIVVDDPKLGRVAQPLNLRSPYIYVDQQAKRFINENRPSRHGRGQEEYITFFDTIGTQTFPRVPTYSIGDATSLKTALVNTAGGMSFFNWYSGYTWSADNSAEIAKGWIVTGATVEELATKLKMDPAQLKATIDTYNSYCDAGADPEFGRPKTGLIKVQTPPFAAVALYPIMYNTQGGPKRNVKCEVIDPYGNPIPRLYSAGECGSFWGWMYNGGGNNSECFATGRIAGRNVATLPAW